MYVDLSTKSADTSHILGEWVVDFRCEFVKWNMFFFYYYFLLEKRICSFKIYFTYSCDISFKFVAISSIFHSIRGSCLAEYNCKRSLSWKLNIVGIYVGGEDYSWLFFWVYKQTNCVEVAIWEKVFMTIIIINKNSWICVVKVELFEGIVG